MKMSYDELANVEIEATMYFLNKLLKHMYKTQRTTVSYTELSNMALELEREYKKQR